MPTRSPRRAACGRSATPHPRTLQLNMMAGYANMKGTPAPKLAVYCSAGRACCLGVALIALICGMVRTGGAAYTRGRSFKVRRGCLSTSSSRSQWRVHPKPPSKSRAMPPEIDGGKVAFQNVLESVMEHNYKGFAVPTAARRLNMGLMKCGGHFIGSMARIKAGRGLLATVPLCLQSSRTY